MPDSLFPLTTSWKPQQWRAPRGDGEWLISPNWSEIEQVTQTNRQRFEAAAQLHIHSQALPDFRQQARREVLLAATRYTQAWADHVPVPSENSPLIVGGHQPALFHPGVWAKNFQIDALAKRVNGTGLNLIVDNDTLHSTSLRVPAGSVTAPRWDTLLFDLFPGPHPWEEISIQEPSLFDSFGERLRDYLQPWGWTPLVEELWPRVVRQRHQGCNLAECISAGRHALEREWGAHNLELPISRMCELPSFDGFVSDILIRLPDFHGLYNSAVREYRELNHIHSRNHPVPDLAEFDGWREAPFWIWRSHSPLRERLFVKQVGSELWLSNGQETLFKISNISRVTEELAAWRQTGWKLRSRALTTTLFARLGFADLFVHGIGGAKYDEMTDQLIQRFWGLPAPRYWTVSATRLLPLPRLTVEAEDERRLHRRLRDLEWNPFNLLDRQLTRELATVVAEFQSLQAQTPKSPEEARARHRQLMVLKDLARPLAQRQIPALHAQLAALRKELEAQKIFNDREYSYGLFPAEMLRGFFAGVP